MYGPVPRSQLVLFCLALIAAFVPPLLLPIYFLFIGNLLMMYVVLALGLGLLIGWSGQFAFAHIAFFGIGIYGTALLHQRLGVPFIFGMPLAAALAGLVGFLIAFPSTRLRTVYLALATFAFAECAQWVFRSWTGVTGGADGLRISPTSVFGYVASNDAVAFPMLAAIMLLVLFFTTYLTRSQLGRTLCTIRDSEHVAAASGIDVKMTKIVAFTISAVYAGIAGAMFTLFHSFVNADILGVNQLVTVLTMVVVGGSSSIPGIILGTLLMGLVPEFLRAAPSDLLVWQEFFYGFILLISVMFMPNGIWGVIAGWRKGRAAHSVAPSRRISGSAEAEQ